MTRPIRLTGAAVLLGVVAACAPARPSLPSGSGTPFPGFAGAYDEAVQGCRAARTAVAELGLSGKAGETRLRGRITAGLAAPAAIRLEGVAFGRPIFILAGHDGAATLLLTREDRVVRDAPVDGIVEALTGVALSPAELLAVMTGCGLGAGTPADGRAFGDDWLSMEVEGRRMYLRRVDGAWRVAAAVRPPLTVLYGEFAGGLPAAVHLTAQGVADITLRVSQLEINTAIDPRAFEVSVPPDAAPLTLDELRRSGPLGERGGLPPSPESLFK